MGRNRMLLAGNAPPVPDHFSFRPDPADLDVILCGIGRNVKGDLLAGHVAALSRIAVNERLGGRKGGHANEHRQQGADGQRSGRKRNHGGDDSKGRPRACKRGSATDPGNPSGCTTKSGLFAPRLAEAGSPSVTGAGTQSPYRSLKNSDKTSRRIRLCRRCSPPLVDSAIERSWARSSTVMTRLRA